MTLKKLIVQVKTIICQKALDNQIIIPDNGKLKSWKNRTYAEAVKDVEKTGKSALGKKDYKVVGNESVDLESIYARLSEASSFSENP